MRPRAARVTPYLKLLAAFLLFATLAFSPIATDSTPANAQGTTGGGQTEPETESPDPPEIDAEAWALMDTNSGVYLGGKNPDKQLANASTTKIMAALVTLDENVDLQREVTISEEAEEFVGFTYSNVGLISGEQVSIRELLVATMVPSGTEAVYALAETVGDGSVEDFVEKMNEKASSMNLENTEFGSPAGLDSENNYSSARDLAKIARAAMNYPEFTEIVAMTEPTITTQSREIQLVTTNKLLYYYPAATGIKTGTSPAAGPSLVSSAKDGEESYIAVVLDAANEEYRFLAAEILLAYGFEDYERRPLVEKNEELERLEVPFRPDESVAVVAAEEVVGLSGPGLEIEQNVTVEDAPPSAEAGQELGTVEAVVNGKSVGRSPVIADTGYEEASFWTKTWYRIKNLFG